MIWRFSVFEIGETFCKYLSDEVITAEADFEFVFNFSSLFTSNWSVYRKLLAHIIINDQFPINFNNDRSFIKEVL